MKKLKKYKNYKIKYNNYKIKYNYYKMTYNNCKITMKTNYKYNKLNIKNYY